MNAEEEIQRIMELWYNIESGVKVDLANIWEERKKLVELEARVERLEPKVIKYLEIIPSLKRHSKEYHAHTVDLIRLIHHIEPTEDWLRKIHGDLNFISNEIGKVKNAIKDLSQARNTQVTNQSLEKLMRIGFEILELINPRGRLSKLTTIGGLTDWMRQNHPEINVVFLGRDFIVTSDSESFWKLCILTYGANIGVAVPPLDSVTEVEIGEWFDAGGKYIGQKYFMRDNVIELAIAEYSEGSYGWGCKKKGRVNLNYS